VKRRLQQLATSLILLMALVILLFPIYWLVATSLKSNAELYATVPTLVPKNPTLEAYRSVLFDRNGMKLLLNSIVAGVCSTAVAIAIALALCYPITRLPTPPRVRGFVLGWSMSLRFLPPVALVIPWLIIIRAMGLYNELPALVIVYTVMNLPFAIWMIKGFLDEVPKETEEAAMIDGATRLQAFTKVILPLAKTGILAAGIIVLAFDWAEFPFALVLTATDQAMTFPVGVQGLVTQFEIIWNDMAAGGVIAIAFPLVLMVAARKYVMSGLTFGVVRDT
jgi:multiple sugar transport system permease protein